MKTIIFSDTHLNYTFEEDRYNYLYRLIESADRVIINGDFIDGLYQPLDLFLESAWNRLFPLLARRETIYIYGNHDKENYIDDRIARLISQVTHEFNFTSGDKSIRVTHGDKLQPGFATYEHRLQYNNIGEIIAPLVKLSHKVESTLISRFGPQAMNVFLHRAYGKHQLDKWCFENLQPYEHLIVGHLHIPYFNKESRFLNSGFINYGHASYILIENEGIELVQETY